MSASAHPARARVRLLAATLVALAALTLTACEDGEGLRDEGPSTPTSPTATTAPTAPRNSTPERVPAPPKETQHLRNSPRADENENLTGR
jgi:hypothetical protein